MERARSSVEDPRDTGDVQRDQPGLDAVAAVEDVAAGGLGSGRAARSVLVEQPEPVPEGHLITFRAIQNTTTHQATKYTG